MSATSQSVTLRQTRTGESGGLLSGTGGLVAVIAAWYRRRRTRTILDDLSDHQLADIGLERSDARYRPASHQPPS